MASRPGRAVLTSFLCLAALGGMEAQEKPYVERVEVNVRTVLVRITDRKGQAPAPPPGVEDLEVLEDGAPMTVLGVDPARPPRTPPPTAPPALPGKPAPAAAPEPASAGIPQHLYVDTTMLEPGSVERLVSAFDHNLSAVLANGPLEIVVADPQPRQALAASRDENAVRLALQQLGRSVAGKQALVILRRQTIDHLRNDLCPNYEMTIRGAAEQELRIIQDSFDRFLRWSVSLGGQRPDVVYFVSDGFDSNVIDTYTRVIRGLAGGNALCASSDINQVSMNLQMEYSAKGGEEVGLAARSLAALGVQAVPLALGGNLKDFGNDASVAGGDGFNSRSGVIPLFAEPIAPLRTLAQATGGEVVTSIGNLPAALGAYDSSFIVSFRSEHPPDGKMHGLQVKSRRQGLTVRSAQFMTEGSPDSVAKGMTVRALHEAPAETGMPVKVSVDGLARDGKEFTGILHVDTDLASLVSTLEQLAGGRMRVTIAVDVEGAREPFTTKQEFDVPPRQAGWGADIPIRWPAKGHRIAVTVEELKTGTRGTGAADLPK